GVAIDVFHEHGARMHDQPVVAEAEEDGVVVARNRPEIVNGQVAVGQLAHAVEAGACDRSVIDDRGRYTAAGIAEMDGFLAAGDQRGGAAARTVDDGAAAIQKDAIAAAEATGTAGDGPEVLDCPGAPDGDTDDIRAGHGVDPRARVARAAV